MTHIPSFCQLCFWFPQFSVLWIHNGSHDANNNTCRSWNVHDLRFSLRCELDGLARANSPIELMWCVAGCVDHGVSVMHNFWREVFCVRTWCCELVNWCSWGCHSPHYLYLGHYVLSYTYPIFTLLLQPEWRDLLSICYEVQGFEINGSRTPVLLRCFPWFFIQTIDHQVVYCLNKKSGGEVI